MPDVLSLSIRPKAVGRIYEKCEGDCHLERQLDNAWERPMGILRPPGSCMVNCNGPEADQRSCKVSRTTTLMPVPGYPMCRITMGC